MVGSVRDVSRFALPMSILGYSASIAAQTMPETRAAPEQYAALEAPPGASEDAGSEVIVTGTRSFGITAAESAAPIKVLSAEAMEHVGQPNLNQILTQLVPSFTAEAFGGDTANLTLTARLRGLSPNHALVLVNGKRRHGTANLHVLSGPFQGAVSPDLDMIPPGAIGRIEVLEDGAAAQYGSDAIAGVINIITKKDRSGLSGSATAGQYYKSDGETYSGTITMATAIGEGGWADLTLFHRFHDFSQRGGADSRMFNRDGSLLSSLSPEQAALYANALGAPNSNRIIGDARSHLTTLFYDTGYDFGDVEVYSFGSYGHRKASAYENFRVPDRVRRSPVLGVRGTLTTPGEMLLYPQGFNPREGIREDDYSATGGIRGDASGWRWDLSSTYGLDQNKIFTLDSANASLYVNTGFTPTDFYSGMFKASEWTNNVDISREFDLGLDKPLNLAFGGEYRENMYEIGAGDEASRYLEGGQSFPGFQSTDAGKHKRHNVAAYVDVSVNPVENLKLDGALRYEDYSDFSTRWTQKLTARYDFSPAFALRGTVSTGFRAPSLLEGFYSATNVGPTSAYVQLPPNSPAAQLLGFDPLKPEKSTNFSAGIVLRPVDRLSITIDGYQIKVRDRIIGSGSLTGTNGGVLVSQAVLNAIAAQGTILDPTVIATGDTGVAIFANGADTRTRGFDITASYPTDFAGGRINWTASANYNKTKITKLILPETLYTLDARSLLESGSPHFKIIGGALFTRDKLTINLRETIYGKSKAYFTDGGEFTLNTVKTAALTDLEIGYDIADPVTISIGANNLFNKKANRVALNSTGGISDGGVIYDAPITFSPYGINGGYYYARINFNF